LTDQGSLRFAEALTPAQKQQAVRQIFDTISADYDRMNDVESFRQHRRWKRALVQAVLAALASPSGAATGAASAEPAANAVASASGATAASAAIVPNATPGGPIILDVACGTGDIPLALAAAWPPQFPIAQIIGLDFSANMLLVAEQRAASRGATVLRPRFIAGDALALPLAADSADVVTISFGLRNLPEFGPALREMVRVLKPGGAFFCLEASYPTNPLVRPFFRLYFSRLMPWRAARLVGHQEQYQWLNDSTEAFLTKPELAALMRESGLVAVSYRSFLCGAAALHQGRKPL